MPEALEPSAAGAHYVLVSVTKPDEMRHDQWQIWLQFSARIASNKKLASEKTRIGENCWLLQRESEFEEIVDLLALVKQARLEKKVLFLRQD